LKPRSLIWLKTSFLFCIFIASCSDSNPEKLKKTTISGNAQGTTYNIIICGNNSIKKKEIDSILNDIDFVLSNYNDQSTISSINKCTSDTLFSDKTGYFSTCFNESIEIHLNTKGAFDPSIHPLVKSWGLFKGNNHSVLSKKKVDSICNFIGFKNGEHYLIEQNEDSIHFKKNDMRFEFDFNAIAQGYSVDVIADFFNSKNIGNYFIELGGEIKVKGLNQDKKPWNIGIDKPKKNKKNERVIHEILSISNKSIATSGNYRKYYIKNGRKYSHTISPFTGEPVQHNLLSATVISNKCSTADAYATAFMVMGLKETKKFITNNLKEKLDVYLIYENDQGQLNEYYSKGMMKYLNK